jgi:hypothetical protein
MATFNNILQALKRRRKMNDDGGDDKDSITGANTVVEAGTTLSRDVDDATGQETLLSYVRTKWIDSNSLADEIDSSDNERSPDGPGRIYNNFIWQKISSNAVPASPSTHNLNNGTSKGAPLTNSRADAINDSQDQTNVEEQESWRMQAARNLKGSGSIESLSTEHLRDRHFFQSRTADPDIALQAAWRQSITQFRALKLENATVSESVARKTQAARRLEEEIAELELRTKNIKAATARMKQAIQQQKADVAREVIRDL